MTLSAIPDEINRLVSTDPLLWDVNRSVTSPNDYLGYLETWLLALVIRSCSGESTCFPLFLPPDPNDIWAALEDPGKLPSRCNLAINEHGHSSGPSLGLVSCIQARLKAEAYFFHLIAYTDPANNAGRSHFVAARIARSLNGKMRIAIYDPFNRYREGKEKEWFHSNLQNTFGQVLNDSAVELSLHDVPLQNAADCGIHAAFNLSCDKLDLSSGLSEEEVILLRTRLQDVLYAIGNAGNIAEAVEGLRHAVAPAVEKRLYARHLPPPIVLDPAVFEEKGSSSGGIRIPSVIESDFNKHLEDLMGAIGEMENYADVLRQQNTSKAEIVHDLATKLREQVVAFMGENDFSDKSVGEFRDNFETLLNSRNRELAQYRFNWKTIIKNIAVALIPLVGILMIAGNLIASSSTQNRAVFFGQKARTSSEEKKAKIENVLNRMAGKKKKK